MNMIAKPFLKKVQFVGRWSQNRHCDYDNDCGDKSDGDNDCGNNSDKCHFSSQNWHCDYDKFWKGRKVSKMIYHKFHICILSGEQKKYHCETCGKSF